MNLEIEMERTSEIGTTAVRMVIDKDTIRFSPLENHLTNIDITEATVQATHGCGDSAIAFISGKVVETTMFKFDTSKNAIVSKRPLFVGSGTTSFTIQPVERKLADECLSKLNSLTGDRRALVPWYRRRIVNVEHVVELRCDGTQQTLKDVLNVFMHQGTAAGGS